MEENKTDIEQKGWFPAMIWLTRIIVGGVFVMSGFVKALDLWGFVFKIEEYLGVWAMMQPRSVVVMGALLICTYEFVFGMLLLMGCYKRLAAWALTASMAFWLPLAFYIWIANPVADCGCFGDFWVLSNFWTFVKNLLLTAMLILLLKYNPKLKEGLYQPAIQWIVGALLTLYLIIVALYGYNVQPMVDFRQYPIGAQLVDETEDSEESADNISFVYEKDGETREFSLDALPDSTWSFVERKENREATSPNSSSFVIYDEDGEDVTEGAVTSEGKELLLIIPEAQRFDISYSSFLNDLYQWAVKNDMGMICLIGADREGIETWQDLSMASYPIYSVDDTKLKELSRGTMSVVLLENGAVKTKFTLSSIDIGRFEGGPNGADFIERIAPRPGWWLKVLTISFGALLLLIFLFQSLILAVSRAIKRKYQKKEVNLQSETATSVEDGRQASSNSSSENNNIT